MQRGKRSKDEKEVRKRLGKMKKKRDGKGSKVCVGVWMYLLFVFFSE